MPDSKRFERDPAEGSRTVVDEQLKDSAASPEEERRPVEEFPPFDDPAFSAKPAEPPVRPAEHAAERRVEDAPESSQSSGHRPTPSPATEKTSGAGPAIAERSKDAKAPRAGRQPGAYVKE